MLRTKILPRLHLRSSRRKFMSFYGGTCLKRSFASLSFCQRLKFDKVYHKWMMFYWIFACDRCVTFRISLDTVPVDGSRALRVEFDRFFQQSLGVDIVNVIGILEGRAVGTGAECSVMTRCMKFANLNLYYCFFR